MKVRYRKARLTKAEFDEAVESGWRAAEAVKIDKQRQSYELRRLCNRPEPDQDAERFPVLDVEQFAR